MPNIVITNNCNLNCSYCFTRNKINNVNDFISIEELYNILKFLNNEKNIGLIGGEPTLHPDFENIVKILAEQNKNILLFTNGVYLLNYSFEFIK